MEGEMITVQEIFKFESRGADPSTGKIIGDFEPTGIRPRIIDRLFDMGIALPPRLAQIFPDRRQVGVAAEKNGHLSGSPDNVASHRRAPGAVVALSLLAACGGTHGSDRECRLGADRAEHTDAGTNSDPERRAGNR